MTAPQAVLVSPQSAVAGETWHGFYYNSASDNSWVGNSTPTLILTGVDDSGTDGQAQVVNAAVTFANAYAKNDAGALASLVNVDAY